MSKLINGHIRLHRSILEWEWYHKPNTFRVFLHLLLKVNWRDGRWEGIEIPRGSCVCSFVKLGEELKLSESKVRTAIKHLETSGEITHESSSQYTVFTVVNYNTYQTDNGQIADESRTDDERITTNEESNKNNKKNKSNKLLSVDKDHKTVLDTWNSLSEYGIAPVRSMSPTSVRGRNLNARLKEFSLSDLLNAIHCVKESDFLLGRKSEWKITFDWFLKSNNIEKILNGNYVSNKQKTEPYTKSSVDRAKAALAERDRIHGNSTTSN